MTKNKTRQTETDRQDTFAAFNSIGAGVRVPEQTRDFVRSQAATAGERAEDMHRQAWTFARQAQPAFGPFANAYASVTRSMLDASLANTQHYFSAIERLADANSLGDALRIQTEFLRESFEANTDRLRKGTEQARDIAGEAARNVQDTVRKAA